MAMAELPGQNIAGQDNERSQNEHQINNFTLVSTDAENLITISPVHTEIIGGYADFCHF